MILLSISNQNGAPRETAHAVMSRPRIFVTMPQPSGLGRNGLCQPSGSPDEFNTAICLCSFAALWFASTMASVVVLGGVGVAVVAVVSVAAVVVSVVAVVVAVAVVAAVAAAVVPVSAASAAGFGLPS